MARIYLTCTTIAKLTNLHGLFLLRILQLSFCDVQMMIVAHRDAVNSLGTRTARSQTETNSRWCTGGPIVAEGIDRGRCGRSAVRDRSSAD